MRRVLAALVAALAFVAPVQTARADGGGKTYCPTCTAKGVSDGSGLSVTIGSPGSAVSPPPAAGGAPAAAAPVAAAGPPQPQTYYQLRPVCYGNSVEDVPCRTAYTCPDPTAYRAWVYSGPTEQGPWTRTQQQVCTGGAPGAVTAAPPPATDAALGVALTDDFPVDPPVLTLNPSAPALVQLPTILSTQPQRAYDVEGQELGVAYTAHVTPSWRWEFSEPKGSVLDATSSGTAYDGTDPDAHPDHYLLHTFTHRGTATVVLTVTWTVKAVRHDTGDTVAVPGATVRRATTTVDVREGRAELTSG